MHVLQASTLLLAALRRHVNLFRAADSDMMMQSNMQQHMQATLGLFEGVKVRTAGGGQPVTSMGHIAALQEGVHEGMQVPIALQGMRSFLQLLQRPGHLRTCLSRVSQHANTCQGAPAGAGEHVHLRLSMQGYTHR